MVKVVDAHAPVKKHKSPCEHPPIFIHDSLLHRHQPWLAIELRMISTPGHRRTFRHKVLGKYELEKHTQGQGQDVRCESLLPMLGVSGQQR
jgi:hypothetical protein